MTLLNQYKYKIKSYNELKAEMEIIQQQMVKARKYERANAIKDVKCLCKEFVFTVGMQKYAYNKGRKNSEYRTGKRNSYICNQ